MSEMTRKVSALNNVKEKNLRLKMNKMVNLMLGSRARTLRVTHGRRVRRSKGLFKLIETERTTVGIINHIHVPRFDNINKYFPDK